MLHAYIAVHGGAGLHSRINEDELKKALGLACNHALRNFESSSLNMVEDAITILENDPHPSLNAGYGSNLTWDGKVECDAAVMDGSTGDFGSVGAVSGVKNPIQLARCILEHSRIPDALGRIPPLTLVSEGARSFAEGRTELVQPESLKSSSAENQWTRWKYRYRSLLNDRSQTQVALSDLNATHDTVGAVAWSLAGTAAGVSSGGLLLKCPGRIGEAAMYGAGCWAESTSKMQLACSVSGAGEYIIRAMLARTIGETLRIQALKNVDIDVHEILQTILVDDFWRSCRGRGVDDPNAGVLLLTTEHDDEDEVIARLWCAFTTPSMAIAYATTKDLVPKTRIIRRPKDMESRTTDMPRFFITALTL